VISDKIGWNVLQNASAGVRAVMHGFTYFGHPSRGTIGMQSRLMDAGEPDREFGDARHLFLRKLRERWASIRMSQRPRRGADAGVEFVCRQKAKRSSDPKSNAHRIVAKKRGRALASSPAPCPFFEVNSFSPPLCITKAEIDEGIGAHGKALDAVTPELRQLANM